MKKIIYFIAIFFCLVSVVDADLKCEWENNIVVPTEENSCVEDAKLSDTGEGCNVSVEATKTSKPESKDYTRVVKNTEDIPKITGGGKPYYVYVLIDDSGSMNQKKTKFVNKSLRSLTGKPGGSHPGAFAHAPISSSVTSSRKPPRIPLG